MNTSRSHSKRDDRANLQPLVRTGHKGIVHSVAFLPDGKQFLSADAGARDGAIRAWKTDQPHEIRSPIKCDGNLLKMAVSNDGRWIATDSDNWGVVIWDAMTHEKVAESLPADTHVGVVECLSFSSDGTRIATGSGDTTIIFWSVPTGKRLAAPFQGHTDAIVSVVFSPDDSNIASTDLHDIRIWSCRSSTSVTILRVIELQSWSLLWTNDYRIYAACNDRIKCIDLSTGRVTFEWSAHDLTITRLSLSQDGQVIVSSSDFAKTVRVWNTTTLQECAPVLQHSAFVASVAISPDGSHVISGGADSLIYVWSMQGSPEMVNKSAAQSSAAITDTDEDNDFGSTTIDREASVSQQERGSDLSVEKRFPNDLTNHVIREGPDPVASGGFADIFRGMLEEHGKSIKVAIKAIKTYSSEDDDFAKKRKRLRREIKVWLNLRHVNVLPLLGTTLGYGRFPAMVCPWVENGPLTSYLEAHPGLSVVNILGLLSNVACGLQYLHSRSIVHGDLSGSNVLIHGNGNACISDFGLSMLLTELGGSTFATSFNARGTLRWTAPELLDLEVSDDMEEEPPHVAPTTQSDVYSFGGIMLQILSGKVPYYYYAREAQVVHAVSRGMTPRRPSSTLVTDDRWAFIQWCWSTVDVVRSRPSSEEIVKFTSSELANANAM